MHLLRILFQELLDADLMFPVITHVVGVGETILGAKPEPGKGCVGTLDMKLKGAVAHGMDVEVVEVDAVQLPQHYGFRHQHPAPDHGPGVHRD